ncbi:MAG: hypothetical protein FWB96_12420 [Defluviitaleaceae bacterium]|nr:hypothetical protein [Defluviitaleaceae bacterium]MCL2264313.1 hypothetical protein [Defluviitaleaceae bacterium]
MENEFETEKDETQCNETQVRINALQIMLRQTNDQSIAHMEAVVGALLQKMQPADRTTVIEEVTAFEKLSPAVLKTVQLCGEIPDGEIPQRQAWRNELAELTAQMETANA